MKKVGIAFVVCSFGSVFAGCCGNSCCGNKGEKNSSQGGGTPPVEGVKPEEVFFKYYELEAGSSIESVEVCDAVQTREESIRKSGERRPTVYIKVEDKIYVFLINGGLHIIESEFGKHQPCKFRDASVMVSEGKGSVFTWYNADKWNFCYREFK